MVHNTKTFLAGKKTYLVAISAFISLVVAWSQGTISGTKLAEDACGIALSVTIRAGIGKSLGITLPSAPPMEGGTPPAEPAKSPEPPPHHPVKVVVEVKHRNQRRRKRKPTRKPKA